VRGAICANQGGVPAACPVGPDERRARAEQRGQIVRGDVGQVLAARADDGRHPEQRVRCRRGLADDLARVQLTQESLPAERQMVAAHGRPVLAELAGHGAQERRGTSGEPRARNAGHGQRIGGGEASEAPADLGLLELEHGPGAEMDAHDHGTGRLEPAELVR
jgi:hypothetical protein